MPPKLPYTPPEPVAPPAAAEQVHYEVDWPYLHVYGNNRCEPLFVYRCDKLVSLGVTPTGLMFYDGGKEVEFECSNKCASAVLFEVYEELWTRRFNK